MPEATPKLRILYCEDDPDTREMMRFALESHGFEVICPDTPPECLRAAKEQRFDAYVLDGRLPQMSGTDLCKQIREFNSYTPIVFFSGLAYQEDRQRALDAGAQAYIIKPADVDEVVSTISSTVDAVRGRTRNAAPL